MIKAHYPHQEFALAALHRLLGMLDKHGNPPSHNCIDFQVLGDEIEAVASEVARHVRERASWVKVGGA